ncbi:aminoacyl-tRNA hydrolase [Flavobacteriaceae bacterium]|nr:aminoacyl-tRNA hydrolase [Flavobacteriaceae bacterium]MDC0559972.1 aminoacyl-tRNA hydrolase [Flavobacteriaceae bacterium]MDC0879471.1 aminoacyl-tRNA hydrolase [Flavobacteriaceae bacterium]MDC6473296.1 aminoacyl-tRNA hydrolase [Flavobacteriaceae bacterium]|tara:strand:+ start:21 stop:653 length:633 start_codon:yes stop_codon:yes gene_type:complete
MYFFKNIVSWLTSKSDMNTYLIIGIGNIGDQYNNTRHNIGFDVVNELSKVLKVGFESVKLAQRAECKFKGKKIILIKPNNYVNNSGKSFLYWKKKEKVSTDNTLVICDDLNLYFGNIKIKSSGTAGGHNGLKDIEEFLGTVNYPRVRIGISNNNKIPTSDYVLGKWSESEQSNIHNLVKISSEIVFSFIQTGIERTMSFYNKKNFIDEDL